MKSILCSFHLHVKLQFLSIFLSVIRKGQEYKLEYIFESLIVLVLNFCNKMKKIGRKNESLGWVEESYPPYFSFLSCSFPLASNTENNEWFPLPKTLFPRTKRGQRVLEILLKDEPPSLLGTLVNIWKFVIFCSLEHNTNVVRIWRQHLQFLTLSNGDKGGGLCSVFHSWWDLGYLSELFPFQALVVVQTWWAISPWRARYFNRH